MYSTAKMLLLMFFSAFLISCDKSIIVEVTKDRGSIIFSLQERHESARDICIESISFQDIYSGKYVWSAVSDGDCIPLNRIVYGQLPAGFRETTSPVPLLQGREYNFMCFGSKWRCGKRFVV